MSLVFSIIDRINPFYSIVTVSIALFVCIFFGISARKGIKRFVTIFTAITLFSALFLNIYSYTVSGEFSNYLLTFGFLQMVEISIVLFSSLNILLFISIYNIENTHFIKILILFLFSIVCATLLIVSRNFLLLYISWCIFLVSIFQLTTGINTKVNSRLLGGRGHEHLLRFFLNSFLVVILFFFGFSIIYGSTDFKNFRQIVESEAVSSPFVIIGTIIFGVGIYLYLFLFPFQSPYLKFMRRCECSSLLVIWFLYFPAGIFVWLKLNSIVYYFVEQSNLVSGLIFIILAFACMVGGNIGAIKTTSLRRILSFIFLFFIGVFLLNYAMLGLGLVNEGRAEWLNIANLIIIIVGFLPVYSFIIHLEKNFGSDSILNLKGLIRKNTYLSLNIIITLLSWCGMIGTIGYLNRYYYIKPFIPYLRFGNVLGLGVLKLVALGIAASCFIFLTVNVFRIIIQFFASYKGQDKDYDRNLVVFPKFYYIYISFFTLIILVVGVVGLMEVLNIDIGFLSFKITDYQIFLSNVK